MGEKQPQVLGFRGLGMEEAGGHSWAWVRWCGGENSHFNKDVGVLNTPL